MYYRYVTASSASHPSLAATLATLKLQAQSGSLPFLALPSHESDLPLIERQADRIRDHFAHLVVLGTGGSSLGGLTLAGLRQSRFLPGGTNVHFIDNSDPDTLAQLFDQLPLSDCCFLAISKSGNTAEVLAQFLLILQRLQRDGLPVARQCLALTMPGDNPLRRLANHFNIPIMEHDPQLGGRFSVLSNVGLLPAAVSGLSLYALREGAKSVMDEVWENGPESAPAQGAALSNQLLNEGKTISVLMPYCDRLENLGRWYQQLWAESIGKQGKGSTPVRALGAVDQHSQLQLYLDGPRDKFITLLQLEQQETGETIASDLARNIGMDYLGEQKMGDIIAAQQEATATSMSRHGVPLRKLILPTLNEQSLGAVLQHFMVETAIMAGLLGVNAFDQPAVEESKQLARESLASSRKVTV